MKNLMDKLSTYAALIGVVGAIGGGFYTWGEFNTRLSAIEGSNVDVSGISKNSEQIAVINEKVDKLDISGIAVLDEKVSKLESKSVDTSGIEENKDAISEVEKKNAVLAKELELLKLELQELKLKAKNPLSQ
tara:strand:+ start:219 stop:614 length:396 start_codon:yes stop_codon:yes gene_type:complete